MSYPSYTILRSDVIDGTFRLPDWVGADLSDAQFTYKIMPDLTDSGFGGIDHFNPDDKLFLAAVPDVFDPTIYILSADSLEEAFEAVEFALGIVDQSRQPEPDEMVNIRWDGTIVYSPGLILLNQIRSAK